MCAAKALTVCESLNCSQQICFADDIHNKQAWLYNKTRNLEANATKWELFICICFLHIFGKIIFTIFHNFKLQILFWHFSVAKQRFVNFLFQLRNMHFLFNFFEIWNSVSFWTVFLAALFFFDYFSLFLDFLFLFLFLYFEWLMTCAKLQLHSCVHLYVCMFACGNRYVCKHEVNIEINSVFFFLFDSSESTHSQSDLAAMWTPVATTAISKANAKLHFKFDFFFYLIFWMIFHFPFFGFFYQYILFSTPLVCLPAPWHELQLTYIQTHICICVHVFTCQTHPWIGWQSHWKAMNGGAAVQKHAKLLPSASMWHRPHATNEQTALCGKKLRKTQRIVAKKFI